MSNHVSDAEFYAGEIAAKLVGGRITTALLTEKDEFGITFFGFRVENQKQQYDVWVQRDPEGNGEGFLAIEPALPQYDG
ncbi:MAG: hypothetical protein VW683_14470 [Betaproteobacteria bacterium]